MHISDMTNSTPPDLDRAKRIIHVRQDILGLSQEELAEKLGVSRGAVGNWELGKPVGLSNLSKMAELSGVGLDWIAYNKDGGMIAIQAKTYSPSNAKVTGAKAQRGTKIPLYGSAVGGEDGQFILNGNKLDDIFAPPSLSGISEAYAVQIAGESMWPRYEDGETVFVNPKRRPVKGDYVIAQIYLEEESTPHAYIKRLVRRTDRELVLEQFNPQKLLTFHGDQVESVHYVLRSGE